MVYVDSRNLGYKPYIYTWLNGRPKQGEVDILRGLFEKYAVPAVDWVLEVRGLPRGRGRRGAGQ